jgi:diguanylate cyclase (GGDEF)-like protein
VVAAHGAVCLGLLAAVLWLDVPYSAVVFLAGPVLLASAYFPQRVYLAMTPPAAAAGLAAVLLRAPDRQEALVAFLGLAVTVAGTSELLFRLGVSHRAAQEQLRRRAALLDALHATTVGLLQGGRAEDLLESLLRRACQLLGTPHGNLFLVEDNRLRCRCALGATRWMQEEALEVRPGQGLSGHVWQTGRPLVVNDYARWTGRLPDPRLAFVRYAAAMPITVHGKVTGVIVVVRGQADGPFSEEETQLVERFAELASLVVQNEELYRAAREELARRQLTEAALVRQHELLRALHATAEELLSGTDFDALLAAVVHRACALLRSNHGNLYLREGDVMRCRVGVGAAKWAEEAGLCLHRGEGMVGRVWEAGQLLVVEDYAAWPGRMPFPQVDDLGPALTVPLRVGHEVMGAFFVARSRGEPPFTDEEVEAARRFGYLASLVLHHARLYREAQEEVARRREAEARLRRRQELLEALHATTQGPLAGAGARELLRAIVQRACELLGSSHGNLYLLEDGVLRCRVGLGAMAWAGQEGLAVRCGEGMVGRVWETGEPVVVENYSQWPGRLRDPRFDSIGGAVSVPLLTEGRFVGAFSVARDRTAPAFTAEEIETVVRFGQLASLVLQNTRLVEQAQAAARSLEEQRAFYEGILNQVESEIAVFDPELRYVYVNPAAVRDPELRRWIIGRDDYAYCLRKGRDPSLAARRQESLRRAIQERRVVEHEETVVTPTGEQRYYVRRACPVLDDEGRVVRVIGYGLDITDRKRAELRLAHLALHDALTGLPNRTLFLDRLQHALDRAGRTGRQVAVLFVDLDRFKGVNDALGHEAGDSLLQQVAQRLQSCVRSSDTLARLAGDEFTVLLEDVAGVHEAQAVAERIQAALQEPFLVAGQQLAVTASVGVALCGPETRQAEELLRRSDAAMYRAKSWGRNRVCVHGPVARSALPATPGTQEGAGALPGTRSPAAGTSEPSRSGDG